MLTLQKQDWNVTPHIFEGGGRLQYGLLHYYGTSVGPDYKLTYFNIACLPAQAKRGMAIKNKIDRQTEEKLKGGRDKMLQRNIFCQPIENAWHIIFFQPNQFGGIFQVERLFQKLWPLL